MAKAMHKSDKIKNKKTKTNLTLFHRKRLMSNNRSTEYEKYTKSIDQTCLERYYKTKKVGQVIKFSCDKLNWNVDILNFPSVTHNIDTTTIWAKKTHNHSGQMMMIPISVSYKEKSFHAIDDSLFSL